MNYSDKSHSNVSQEIVLKEREDLMITGIKRLESLNPEEFIIETTLGVMVVRGTNLEMKHLDIEKGNLHIIGNVYLLEYQDGIKPKKQKGFLSKLFK